MKNSPGCWQLFYPPESLTRRLSRSALLSNKFNFAKP